MVFFQRRKSYSLEILEACRQHPAPRLETIKRLLSLDPSAVRTRDEYGNTLLHVVCSRPNTPYSVVQALVQAFPEAVRSKDPRDGSLPLHLAVASHAPLDVIQLLMASHPDAVQCLDKLGNLPLHLACATKAPFEVFLVIQQAWPEAVRRRNFDSDALPLHGACTETPATFASRNDFNFAVIWSLLEAFPDAVMSRDSNGDTPYDLLQRGSPTREMVQLLRTKRALAQMPEQERQRHVDRQQRKLQMKKLLQSTDLDNSTASTASNASWDEDYKMIEVKSARYKQHNTDDQRKKKKKSSRKKKKKSMVEESLEI